MALSSIYSMAGEIGVDYLEQCAPAVPCHGRLLLSVFGRQRLLHLPSAAAIINIKDFTTHNLQLPTLGLQCDTLLPAHGNTHMCIRADTGTNSSRASLMSMAQRRLKHVVVTAISRARKKNCFLCHSRGICFRRAVLQRSQNE